MENKKQKCPSCEATTGQMKNGQNRSGTQRIVCRHCKKSYTLDPKKREISEEIRKQAIKTYYSGTSGRGVGKIYGFSKANVYNWIKKNPSEADE